MLKIIGAEVTMTQAEYRDLIDEEIDELVRRQLSEQLANRLYEELTVESCWNERNAVWEFRTRLKIETEG